MSVPSAVKLFLCTLLVQTLQIVSAATAGASAQPPNNTEWSGWGGNVYNNRWASTNTQINSSTISQLEFHCKLDYPQGVSATPVVLDNTVYYPTSNGSFYALNLGTCEYEWQVNVTKICWDFQPLSKLQQNNTLPMSRTSPQIEGNVLYFATQAHALIVAVDLATGDFLGAVQVHDHPLAILTMSPTLYKGTIFIGASSQEESATLDPQYDGKCCNFVGNFAAFSFDSSTKKFQQLWNIYTLPLDKGWSGASVWGSQPSIDPLRNQVFVGTGNTYIYPSAYIHCINETASCLPPDVWQESVIALDIATGKVNWRKTISPLDAWVMVCGYAGENITHSPLCPESNGPDADFGMAPTFVPAALGDGTSGIDSVIIGQKNGFLYSFDAITGDIQWHVITSPDSSTAGALSWGLAVDDSQIYFTAINFGQHTWTLQPSGPSINNSAFGAANLKTGALVWETPTPDNQLAYTPPGVVNDIVFVGKSGGSKTPQPGAVIALEKKTGNTLQTWPVDSVQRGGISIHGGFIMFGTGYHYSNPYHNGSFYVMGLPDAIAQAKSQTSSSSLPKNTATSGTNFAGGEGGSSNGTKKNGAASRLGETSMMVTLYPMVLLAVLIFSLG